MTINSRQIESGTWEPSFSTAAPMPAVFEYVVDFERHVDWEEQLLEVKNLGRKAREPGAKYLKTYGTRPNGFWQWLFWKPIRIDCKIKALDPPRRMIWQQQLWRDQPSDSYDYQEVELLLSPSGTGCEVTFVRHLMTDDAVSAEMAMGVHNLLGSLFRRVSPEVKEKLREEHRRRHLGKSILNGFDRSRDEVAGEFLEDLPIRGPGSRSLTRLKAVIETRRR
jgi:hypothetical protein